MVNDKAKTQDYYVVDFMHILRFLWKKLWIIVLSGILAAVMAFCYAAFIITPQYASTVMLYVNNSSFSLGSSTFSISSSELTAAQSLVKTYTVMLKNRTTLNQVIEKTGLDYTVDELYYMIEAASVNDTEVLAVTVTTENAKDSAELANAIAEVLPVRISEIIEGSSMKVVDLGVVNEQKVSPNISRYTEVGLLLGVLISVIVLVIMALMDDTIHDEEYLLKTYDYPILAKVPNLLDSSDKQYAYYYQRKKNVK
ncbi:MAG: hypothetical protein IJC86_00465 [Clostridia bacterium]|nr:hypothetical protein [Clostridia bacterium]